MGTLTPFLQREFARLRPEGWQCHYEQPLLSAELARLLGYTPRADVLLEQEDGSRRLWIEFEVSRADPVANHAKFATAHLFAPQSPADVFVAMVSPHVTRGRRNLAANTIHLMRHVGMQAFQTVLFPHLLPAEVLRLNHLTQARLDLESLAIDAELERVLTITSALQTAEGQAIHFAGDLLDVLLNLRQWNQDLATPSCADLWGRRTVTYFVYDPRSRDFAPSKFCAFTPIPAPGWPTTSSTLYAGPPAMTIRLYASLEKSALESAVIFDGGRAWRHLTRRLGMIARRPAEAPEIQADFSRWLACHEQQITVHPSGPVFLVPPGWF